jgi:hypothetical protein
MAPVLNTGGSNNTFEVQFTLALFGKPKILAVPNGFQRVRATDPTTRSMIVEPYQNCQGCGGDLNKTTVYRRHAYCNDCDRTL